MPFFDFHVHPGLKPSFSDQKTAVSPWTFIDAKLAIFKKMEISINFLINDVKLFGNYLKAGLNNEAIDTEALMEDMFYCNRRDFISNRLRSIGK